MTEWVQPQANPRGSIVMLAGRGEDGSVYDRFTRRLAFDGYRSTVLETDRSDDAGAARARITLTEAAEIGIVVLAGSDAGALTAASVATDVTLDGLILAGLPTGTGASGQATSVDGHDARSACPVHLGVLRRAVATDALARPLPAPDVAAISRVTVPVLALHGAADTVSPASDARVFYDAFGDGDVVMVEGGRHDILNDVSHRSVAAEIVQFLERLRGDGAPVLRRTRATSRVPAAV